MASGGELSRLSLAVQVSVAARETRCMVFDEVDSGIGGAIAEIVGRELRSLGERGQVLCVTHLPQVASQGHHHLRVAKSTDGRTTRTSLTDLTPTDRVEEIARMLGGVEVTGKAREHAKEMLRTHLELPPDPTPTDRMPALKLKDVLAQAKVAAKDGKDPAVEPKSLGWIRGPRLLLLARGVPTPKAAAERESRWYAGRRRRARWQPSWRRRQWSRSAATMAKAPQPPKSPRLPRAAAKAHRRCQGHCGGAQVGAGKGRQERRQRHRPERREGGRAACL